MRKIFSKPLYVVLTFLLTVVLVLSGMLGLQWFLDPLDCRMDQEVSIGGLDVGGMYPWEAYQAVEAAAEEWILYTPLLVELPRETLDIQPQVTKLEVDIWDAVWDAYRVGRSDGAEEKKLLLSMYLQYDEAYIRGLLTDYAARYDTSLTQPSWKLRGLIPALGTDVYDPEEPGQTVELTLGLPECRLDVEAALAQVVAAYDSSLSGLKTLTLDVEPAKLPEEPDLDNIYATCALAAKDDSLDMQSYQLVPGSFGYHFDMEKAQAMVASASYGETVSIPMEAAAPEIFGEDVYYRDVLGSCETKHTTDENRNTNLRLLCQFLNGMVIQPGEEFSYNQAVGERTPERGFKPATVFAGNRKAKDYGGGVCQGSTTLYNCLLIADMEVTKRYGHGALVTYVPLGLDAAVNWSTDTDLRFINNSHFPVKIQAEVSDGYVKMKLLGTDEKDYYIKMETKQYQEGDYFYATSYKCKYDKKTDELISRKTESYSTYVAELEG